MKNLTLTLEDQELVKEIAKKRTDSNKKAGTHYNWGRVSAYDIDLEGFGAEVAFCRMFYCEPDLTTQIRKGGYDTISKKGNKIDIKWTSIHGGELLVKTSKPKGEIDIYALLVGRFPTYQFVGYATSDEVYSAPITNYGYTDNYTIPVEKLHKIN